MSVIVRSWIAFAAIGVGLIHLAFALGSPPLIAVPLALLGVAEFGWGVVTFARDAVPLPRVAFGVALAPVLVWIVVLLIGTVPEPWGLVPLAIAATLELAVAALVGRSLARRGTPAPPAPGIARYLIGVLAGGLVVVALTTPALAAIQAGLGAPNGTPEQLFEDPAHGH